MESGLAIEYGGGGGGKVRKMAKKVSFTAYSSCRLQLLQMIFV